LQELYDCNKSAEFELLNCQSAEKVQIADEALSPKLEYSNQVIHSQTLTSSQEGITTSGGSTSSGSNSCQQTDEHKNHLQMVANPIPINSINNNSNYSAYYRFMNNNKKQQLLTRTRSRQSTAAAEAQHSSIKYEDGADPIGL